MSINDIPTSWLITAIVLAVMLIVVAILYILKICEARLLKKEVAELRETILMMRQEEADLSRMVHVASVKVEEKECSQTEQFLPVSSDSDMGSSFFESPWKETETTETLKELEEQEKPDTPETTIHTEMPAILSNEATNKQRTTENKQRTVISHDLFADWFMENNTEEEKKKLDHTEESSLSSSSFAPKEQSTGSKIPETSADSDTFLTDSPKDDELSVHLIAREPVLSDENNNSDSPRRDEKANISLPPTDTISKEDGRFCRKLERIVNARMRNPNLNIDAIATQFGMGRTNFYRKVRELTGMSPNDYLRKCRMERAEELLRTTQQPVVEICALVGMPDAQYFSRVFKSYYGSPPSTYRESVS